jgi:hypothetical protein
MRPTSQSQLEAARKLLTDAQLIAFFRLAGIAEHCPTAVKIINRDLDKGESLDTFVGHFGKLGAANGGLDLKLLVEPVEGSAYRISYGLHGGMSGDGSTWIATYGEEGELLGLEQESYWIS